MHLELRNPIVSWADPTGKGGILPLSGEAPPAELYLGKTRQINHPETLELSIQSDPKLSVMCLEGHGASTTSEICGQRYDQLCL